MSEYEFLATRGAVEIRSAGGKSSRTIGGTAALFNSQSENLGGFVECVGPSFFNASQAANWPSVTCRFNHSDDFLLGATRSQTLRLSVDAVGLQYVVDLPETRSDIYELVARGDIANSSFAFSVDTDTWSLTDGGVALRTLVSGKLIDVAPVSSPAYSSTTVGLRSLARYASAPLEDVLDLAKAGELRKFLIRTDLSPAQAQARIAAKARLTGATAKALTKSKASPALPGVTALAKTLGKKHAKQVVV